MMVSMWRLCIGKQPEFVFRGIAIIERRFVMNCEVMIGFAVFYDDAAKRLLHDYIPLVFFGCGSSYSSVELGTCRVDLLIPRSNAASKECLVIV
jgi:hypothetical protein